MIKVCRHTWGCIQDDKGVSSYMGFMIKMIKVCRHTWDLYKMIKVCRHTIIQDDKGVSSYMGIYTR